MAWSSASQTWPNRDHSRFVTTPAVDFHVQIAGEGPTLLLLHGAGGSTHSWAQVLPILAREFQVVAPDLPGHAFSSPLPPRGTGLPGVATAVTDLLDALDTRPKGIVAHSAGAAVASRMIQADGLRPAGWVALAPSLVRPSRGAVPPVIQDLLAPALRSAGMATALAALGGTRGITDALLRSTGSRVPPESRRIYRQLTGNPAHLGAVLRLVAAWEPEVVTRRLPELDLPTLFLAGREDGWIPLSDVEAAASRIPGVDLRVLPDLGHLLHEEAPEQVLAHALPFLREVLGGP